MFKVGDKVVHPMHGAGVIDSIVSEKINGTVRDYYVFVMPHGGLVLKIPLDSSGLVGLRAVVDAPYAEAVIAAVGGLETSTTVNWSQRYRENLERLKSGNLYEVARVIKTLMLRDAQRGLSTGERKMLHSAKQIFISEIALVMGNSYDEIEGRLNSSVVEERA